jgi:hypothetical protein
MRVRTPFSATGTFAVQPNPPVPVSVTQTLLLSMCTSAMTIAQAERGARCALIFVSVVLLAGCARRSPQIELTGETMGTSFTVKIVPRAG